MVAKINMSGPQFLDNYGDRRNYVSILSAAVFFAVITYAALTMRAVLSPFEVHYFLDLKRILSVLVGTYILWIAMRATQKVHIHGLGAQFFAILQVSIAGVGGLFLVREAYDLTVSGEIAQRLELNIRWILTWIGYFGAAIGAFLALSYHRQLQDVLARVSVNEIDKHSASLLPEQTEYELAAIELDPRNWS